MFRLFYKRVWIERHFLHLSCKSLKNILMYTQVMEALMPMNHTENTLAFGTILPLPAFKSDKINHVVMGSSGYASSEKSGTNGGILVKFYVKGYTQLILRHFSLTIFPTFGIWGVKSPSVPPMVPPLVG